jgi:hypothetical protein
MGPSLTSAGTQPLHAWPHTSQLGPWDTEAQRGAEICFSHSQVRNTGFPLKPVEGSRHQPSLMVPVSPPQAWPVPLWGTSNFSHRPSKATWSL